MSTDAIDVCVSDPDHAPRYPALARLARRGESRSHSRPVARLSLWAPCGGCILAGANSASAALSPEAIDRIVSHVGRPIVPDILERPDWRSSLADHLKDALDATSRAFAGRTFPNALREIYVREREMAFRRRLERRISRAEYARLSRRISEGRARRARRFGTEFEAKRKTDPSLRRPEGRPLEYELDVFVERLCWTWIEFFQLPVRASRDNARGESTGPLVRFVRQCAAELSQSVDKGAMGSRDVSNLDVETPDGLTTLRGLATAPESVRDRIRKVMSQPDGPTSIPDRFSDARWARLSREARGCSEECDPPRVHLRVIPIRTVHEISQSGLHGRSQPSSVTDSTGGPPSRTE